MTSVCCQIPLEEASPHVFVSHRWMDLFLGYVVHQMLCNKIGSNSKMTKYVEPSILRRGRWMTNQSLLHQVAQMSWWGRLPFLLLQQTGLQQPQVIMIIEIRHWAKKSLEPQASTMLCRNFVIALRATMRIRTRSTTWDLGRYTDKSFVSTLQSLHNLHIHKFHNLILYTTNQHTPSTWWWWQHSHTIVQNVHLQKKLNPIASCIMIIPSFINNKHLKTPSAADDV